MSVVTSRIAARFKFNKLNENYTYNFQYLSFTT